MTVKSLSSISYVIYTISKEQVQKLSENEIESIVINYTSHTLVKKNESDVNPVYKFSYKTRKVSKPFVIGLAKCILSN